MQSSNYNPLLIGIRKVLRNIKHFFRNTDYEISQSNYKELLSTVEGVDKEENMGLEAWDSNRKQLRNNILQNNIKDFLNWDVVQNTMFFEPPVEEYEKVMGNDVLKKAIVESKIGCPKPYYMDYKTSGNLITHASHLLHILDKINLDKVDSIVEFGGGYGSMCRLLRNIGYKKDYILFDLPEFLALQKFFISEVDKDYLKNTEFVSDMKNLPKVRNSLLIATWSLSEADMKCREDFLNRISFDYCLIGFQKNFHGIDDLEYFEKFKKSYPNISFEMEEIDYIKGNYYLIGVKK